MAQLKSPSGAHASGVLDRRTSEVHGCVSRSPLVRHEALSLPLHDSTSAERTGQQTFEFSELARNERRRRVRLRAQPRSRGRGVAASREWAVACSTSAFPCASHQRRQGDRAGGSRSSADRRKSRAGHEPASCAWERSRSHVVRGWRATRRPVVAVGPQCLSDPVSAARRCVASLRSRRHSRVCSSSPLHAKNLARMSAASASVLAAPGTSSSDASAWARVR